MKTFDLDANIGYWLTVSTQAIHRALNDELAPTGITYRQSQVVAWLKIDGELAVNELACRMMIEPPTLVGILDRMEGTGWVIRHSCTHDRRRKLVQLTPAAEPAWERIVECSLRVRTLATAGLTPEQTETLIGLLRTIHQNLIAATALRPGPHAECESA